MSTEWIIAAAFLLVLLIQQADEPIPVPVTDEPQEDTVPSPTINVRAYSREELEQLALVCANARGASFTVLAALCDIETAGWDAYAANLSGGDARRGGAYGPAQVTLTTARAVDDKIETAWREIDPSRSAESLAANPELSLLLAAALVAENEARVRTVGGDVRDVAALYNSGKMYAQAPSSTRGYVERFLAAYQRRTGSRAWS